LRVHAGRAAARLHPAPGGAAACGQRVHGILLKKHTPLRISRCVSPPLSAEFPHEVV
jgi:hypothetical protein